MIFLLLILLVQLPCFYSTNSETLHQDSMCQPFIYDDFGYKVDWTNKANGWTSEARKYFLEFQQRIRGGIDCGVRYFVIDT